MPVPALERRRREQGEEGEGEHQRGDRQVQQREQDEDDQRREERHQELRQVLAEVGLELLDPVDHRDHDGAGALQAEVRGPERHDLGVEALAQRELHAHRRAMRDHGAGMLRPAAQHHHGAHQRGGRDQIGERIPGEDAREQPAEQREPPDADERREDAHRHGADDAQAHAFGELPKALVEYNAVQRRTRKRRRRRRSIT